MKVHNEDWAIGKAFWSIHNHRDKDGNISYKKGVYNHKNGTVLIYQQGHIKPAEKLLRLTIYRDGRGYYRTILGKLYTDIGIARKAKEFARDIYKKES